MTWRISPWDFDGVFTPAQQFDDRSDNSGKRARIRFLLLLQKSLETSGIRIRRKVAAQRGGQGADSIPPFGDFDYTADARRPRCSRNVAVV